MTATLTEPMTSELLFKMRPKKNLDRWIFRGELREEKVTKRNPHHSDSTAKVSFSLTKWLLTRPKPRGNVYTGEAYFRIRKEPETNVGVDVALATPEQVANLTKKSSYVDGVPILAVEILSPYDKKIDIDEMIEEYLDCGTPLVWIVDPRHRTVAVHRADAEPVMYNSDHELKDFPELPGFACKVYEYF
jgi:Uma2 family endonuclease